METSPDEYAAECRALIESGHARLERNNLEDALSNFQLAYLGAALIDESDDDTNKVFQTLTAEALQMMGVTMRLAAQRTEVTPHLREATSALELAASLAKQAGDYILLGAIMRDWALCDLVSKGPDEAFLRIEQSKRALRQVDESQSRQARIELGATFGFEARIHQAKGDMFLALMHYYRANNILTGSHDVYERNNLLHLIALEPNIKKRSRLAARCFQLSLKTGSKKMAIGSVAAFFGYSRS